MMKAYPAVCDIFNSNPWRRFNYWLLSPIYDRIARVFDRPRHRSVTLARLKPGERLLIVGAGTGLDLECLPPGVLVMAIDLTPAMIGRLRKRAQALQLTVDARVMDGQRLEFPDGSFDAVLLHLILSVIPEPVRCIREAARVLRPGGRVAIFDKFIPDVGPTPIILRLLNPLMTALGTSLTRRLNPMLAVTDLRVEHDEPLERIRLYRIVIARKPIVTGLHSININLKDWKEN